MNKPILLIGSAAARANGVDIPRKPLDVDFMCAEDDFMDIVHAHRYNGKGVVKDVITTPSGRAIKWLDGSIWDAEFVDGAAVEKDKASALTFACGLESSKGVACTIPGLETAVVPSLDFLLMLKMSHRYLKNSKHFLKTMQDIKYLRWAGAVIPESMQATYEARMKATYNYGHPKLNVTSKEFFTDDVPYRYDHDSIHVAVAIEEGKPAYTNYMSDGAQVLTSREKFDSLPTKIKLLGVLEESFVLALERSVIPHGSSPRKAFMMALSKVCTSITSGWFREYAWENYDRVVALYEEMGSDDYVRRFEKGLRKGIVKPYSGSKYKE